MTQNPYTPQNAQETDSQPMNVYPAPGVSDASTKPTWPTVVGIISLCLAGFFGLMTIIGQIINFSGINPQQREIMKNAPDWVEPMQLSAGAFAVIAYIVLAIAGANLLKRRLLGRKLHLVYAVMGIVVAVAGLAIGLTIVSIAQPPANMPPAAQSAFKISMTVGPIIGLPFALAYPVFLLIWFGRAKVKQHIQTWQN